MKTASRGVLALLGFVLAPGTTFAQFETLEFVDLPAIGSWAEYRVTTRSADSARILPQVVSLVSRSQVGGQEYLWFQVETEVDGIAEKRQSLVYQVAIPVAAAAEQKHMFTRIQETIVQVGERPAFRVSKDFLEVGVTKKLLVGVSGGAGIDYQYRDLDAEELETPAGMLVCDHKKGIGEGEVVLSYEDPKRFGVESIVDLWYSDAVPFGMVKRMVRTTGKEEVVIGGSKVSPDIEELTELVAWGVGAKSAIQGEVFDYSPAAADMLRPVN